MGRLSARLMEDKWDVLTCERCGKKATFLSYGDPCDNIDADDMMRLLNAARIITGAGERDFYLCNECVAEFRMHQQRARIKEEQGE